jgi:hypothetical protein
MMKNYKITQKNETEVKGSEYNGEETYKRKVQANKDKKNEIWRRGTDKEGRRVIEQK